MIGTILTSTLGQFTTIVRFHLAYTHLSSLAVQLTQFIHSLVEQLGAGAVIGSLVERLGAGAVTGIDKLQTTLDRILSVYSPLLSSVALSDTPCLNNLQSISPS
ncbi:hypothetical protein MJO28_015661 [Puccinia striiformis f. sp. tritici]|uniref:Uncharacterized protein n=1 Tax=Puccinia striiformis f. sp. tritici TaxID=168172 RepID=A0ACC0DQG3_9BASI|nr:hypothetical protein MJO29_015724 [Puccinia striiformis f. sp. tritici]KAI7936762.1 hypothetical protein MJO28_015661 [Puccinia striiformis f. sp. tritici]